MKIIFDFDYTLYDTARFKEALISALEELGPSREEIVRAYGAGQEYGEESYQPEAHVGRLGESLRCSPGEAVMALEAVAKQGTEFVYPGAAAFLRRLQQQGHTLVLLTLGDEGWQRLKVLNSGLADCFDAYYATAHPKTEMLPRLTADDECVIVNDNGAEIEAMMAVCPSARFVLKIGLKAIPPGLKIPVCRTFEEIEVAILS
jgi:phosphoglycolate phosphatase-like HAD superfamily hydrolase